MVYVPRKLRDAIRQRAQYCCEYCKTPEQFSGASSEVDHAFPQSLGGETNLDNLAAACRSCNSHKSDAQNIKDPETGELVSLFNPREDAWKEHFTWSENGLKIMGLSAKGRASIERLKMNNDLILMARQMWLKAGWIALSN